MKKFYRMTGICLLSSLLSITASAQVTNTDICNNNIRHYWKLDETQGSDLQDIINNNNASEKVNTVPSAGKIGGSQYFNGTSEVNIPNDNDFNWTASSSFSFEFWMKKTAACLSGSSSDNNVIIGRDDSTTNLHWWVGASCEFSGRVSFNLFDVSGNGMELVGKKVLTDGNWHHIVVTRDGSNNTSTIYVDGSKDTSAVKVYSNGFQSIKNINVGYLNLSGKYHYNGYLDELAYYNTALPLNIIQEHYNAGNGEVYCTNTPVSRVKIMPLGNSMTEGWTDGSLNLQQMRAYRYDLKNFLEGNGYRVDFVGSQLTGSAFFTDCQNAGIDGTRDQYLSRLLTDGFDERNNIQILNPPRAYLDEFNPDIILLDVGTNDVTHEATPWAPGVEKFTNILDQVDGYEQRAGKQVTVILALIINRRLGEPLRDSTTVFNNHIRDLAQARINAGDHIVIVDLEHDAGFEYNDNDMTATDIQGLHPNAVGYTKMAIAWMSKLTQVLPQRSFRPQSILSPGTAGTVNLPYASKVFAIGNPTMAFSVISGPSGLTINSQTGIINWTPSLAGDYSVSALISNSAGADTSSWVIHVASSGNGGCTNETFTTATGTVTDNSGSANYLDNMTCSKLIQPANASSITLSFTQFNTEAGYDFVRVYNGPTTSYPLLGQFSGNNLPASVTSTGGVMLITFTTDGGVTGQGWSANYTSTAGGCVNETLTAASGTVTDNSGTGNYSDNMACQKLIQPTNASVITLTFTQFSTEAGYDFVRVYNGPTTSSPLLGQFSGNNLPPALTATGGSMLIVFTTDGGVTAQGWSANYTSTAGGCVNETFTTATGTVTDNSGAGNYLDNMTCSKLIQPANASSITLTFTQFSTEAGYDFVRVYNGATTSSPLLGQYSGTNLPPSVTATGGSMLITFTTDGGVVAQGWSANYTSTAGGCVNETFTTATGTVTDNSGAGNYVDNMSCQKLIQPTSATSVTLTFTQFSTEAGYDFVRVYNGSTTSAPLLGQYSGTNLPPSVTSTGGSMLITFTTDGGVVAQGWSANYTSTTGGCVNETFTSASGTVTDNSGAANYVDNMSCQKLIQPANAASITLTFTQFNTEAGYDFVRVYNGPTTAYPLLGQYSGNNLPPTVTSTGGIVLITFTTDGGVVGQGWSVNYTSTTGGCVNETLTTATGTITDNSGAGNYVDNMSCQKLIQPANASSVTLTFTQFSTEAGYDFVRVYNGATTSAPLMGQYSGNSLPPVLTSTGGSMLVTFTTDGGVVAQGWSANYTSSTALKSTRNGMIADSALKSEGMQIIVYPNPLKDLMTIETLNTDRQNFTLELINASGEVVLNKKAFITGQKYDLDVSKLYPGLYILKVTADEMVKFVRVIKQ